MHADCICSDAKAQSLSYAKYSLHESGGELNLFPIIHGGTVLTPVESQSCTTGNSIYTFVCYLRLWAEGNQTDLCS